MPRLLFFVLLASTIMGCSIEKTEEVFYPQLKGVEGTFFRDCLKSQGRSKLSVVHINCSDDGIRSLKGIETFPNLEYLSVPINRIEQADLSQNSKLHYINIQESSLSGGLNLDGLTEIREIYVDVYISGSVLANNLNLEKLYIGGISQASEVKELSSLSYLSMYGYSGGDLDFNLFPSLKSLQTSYTSSEPIDLSLLMSLENLTFWRYSSASLDLSSNIALGYLSIRTSALEEIDIGEPTALGVVEVICIDDHGLDIIASQESQVRTLSVKSCNNAEMNLQYLSNLSELTLWEGGLNKLVLAPNVEKISFSYLALPVFDGTNLNLVSLSLNNTNINHYDLSSFTDLTYLSLRQNNLTSVDLSGLINLTSLDLSQNNLTDLDLPELTGLTYLNLSQNKITELRLIELINLTSLNLDENNLLNVNLSGLPVLHRLQIDQNSLTELNLINSPGLSYLSASDNKLTRIELGNIEKYGRIDLSSNKLAGLPANIRDIDGYLFIDLRNNTFDQATTLELRELKESNSGLRFNDTWD